MVQLAIAFDDWTNSTHRRCVK